jgi:hypothetical protein
MNSQKLKEACRLYYIVKGHLPKSLYREDEQDSIIEHFGRRVWRMEEVYLREEGFEQAFIQFNKERLANEDRTYSIDIRSTTLGSHNDVERSEATV